MARSLVGSKMMRGGYPRGARGGDRVPARADGRAPGRTSPAERPLGPTPAEDIISTLFFGSHELGNLIAFVATCGPYTRNDGLRIYARIAADYSAYNARAWQVRYGQPIVASVPRDERALRCGCPRIPDLHRAIATASLLAYNLDDFVDDPKALGNAHQLVLGGPPRGSGVPSGRRQLSRTSSCSSGARRRSTCLRGGTRRQSDGVPARG
jgi:hypothetical protein